MTKEIQKTNSDQISRLVSRLAEFKLTQEQTPREYLAQANTSTRSVSSQTFVPTAAQLAEVERILVFFTADDEPMPSPEEIYHATIACQLKFNWW